MRYILYDPHFTKNNPFFRIGNEGVSKKELLLGFIDAEMPEDLQVIRFGDLIITDLDTFFRRATAAQRKEVKDTLELLSKMEQESL